MEKIQQGYRLMPLRAYLKQPAIPGAAAVAAGAFGAVQYWPKADMP